MTSKKTLKTYKADAIVYYMYFGKAHAYQTEWLREYTAKQPLNLPFDIVPRSAQERLIRDKIDAIDAYEDWTNSEEFSEGVPKTLKELISTTFSIF